MVECSISHWRVFELCEYEKYRQIDSGCSKQILYLRLCLISVNFDPAETEKVRQDMCTALKARRAALEEDLRKRTEELKLLCIKEGVSGLCYYRVKLNRKCVCTWPLMFQLAEGYLPRCLYEFAARNKFVCFPGLSLLICSGLKSMKLIFWQGKTCTHVDLPLICQEPGCTM